MKTFLVICALLIGFTCYASGPVLRDCDAASVTVTQTIDLVSPALIPEAVVFYELPFAGIVPELGMPLQSAELAGYDADIWHPPVLNSTSWLRTTKSLDFCEYPRLDGNAFNCRSDKLLFKGETTLSKVFDISWFDIA